MRGRLNGGQENLIRDRTPPDEQYLIDYVACLAEIAVSRLLNRAWTGCGRAEDGSASYDVGSFLQVRSITDRSYGLITREKDNPHDITALVHVDRATRVCTLLGGARNSDVRAYGVGRDLDTEKPYWTLPQSSLCQLEDLLTLTWKT